MRFKNFLNEELKYGYREVVKNCRVFLNDVKKQQAKNEVLLWSGRIENQDSVMKKVRKDRKPRDTPEEIHNILDELFKKYFGVKARSESIFCYREANSDYGSPFAIFPIGRYKLLYSSKVNDLYDKLHRINFHFLKGVKHGKDEKYLENLYFEYLTPDEQHKYGGFEGFEEAMKNFMPTFKKKAEEIVKDYKVINASELPKVNVRNEIMVICESYIGIDVIPATSVIAALKHNGYI